VEAPQWHPPARRPAARHCQPLTAGSVGQPYRVASCTPDRSKPWWWAAAALPGGRAGGLEKGNFRHYRVATPLNWGHSVGLEKGNFHRYRIFALFSNVYNALQILGLCVFQGVRHVRFVANIGLFILLFLCLIVVLVSDLGRSTFDELALTGGTSRLDKFAPHIDLRRRFCSLKNLYPKSN
jgi:hypothetical protein